MINKLFILVVPSAAGGTPSAGGAPSAKTVYVYLVTF
jgi:hypothetical protein